MSAGECDTESENESKTEQSVVGKCLTVREPIYRIISGGLSSRPVGSG